MKLAGGGVLFPPACSNEQAFRNRLGKLVPGGTHTFCFSSVRCVQHTRWKGKKTHVPVKCTCEDVPVHADMLKNTHSKGKGILPTIRWSFFHPIVYIQRIFVFNYSALLYWPCHLLQMEIDDGTQNGLLETRF